MVHSAVGYRCVDDWRTDVSWVWRIPIRNAAVCWQNNIERNDQLLQRGPPTTTLRRPNVTQPRMLSQFTTPTGPNITLLQATTRGFWLHQGPRVLNHDLCCLQILHTATTVVFYQSSTAFFRFSFMGKCSVFTWSFISILLFLFVNMQLNWILMSSFSCLVNYGVVLPLVIVYCCVDHYRCLMGMEDTKPQRLRLTT
jgi:hypothetical protein